MSSELSCLRKCKEGEEDPAVFVASFQGVALMVGGHLSGISHPRGQTDGRTYLGKKEEKIAVPDIY